jgi:predicted TIM-barrel fold metal-dependent hydrolase
VVVTPAVYETDNLVTLDAIARLGEARGVAVVHPTVTDAELKLLADGGICGIRFTQFDPATAVTTLEMIEPLSRRVADLGWHIQIHMRADQIAAAGDLWEQLPSTIRRLIDKGRTWVKLSGAYLDTKVGPPTYADATAVARAFAAAAPERMVWGSDWPHPTETQKPDDAVLFDVLADWVPDAATRQRVLVTNPQTLYGFAPSS